MQVYISGSSPLLQYSPCRACEADQGWQSAPVFNNNEAAVNGTDKGFMTTADNANVSVSFIGTGLKFDMAYAPAPGAGGPGSGAGTDAGSAWETSLLVNGTAPPSTATTSKASVQNLPPGTHNVTYTLKRTGKANETWAQVLGVTGTLEGHAGPSTTNATIDDSAWRSGAIVLSEGWNMLEVNGASNYLDETDYQAELASARRMYNSTVSWTVQPNASTTITFNGSAVWAYGTVGGDAGTFTVSIDGTPRGIFTSSGGPRTYNTTLYHTSNLSDGPHTLQLTNTNGRLSLDRVVFTKGLEAQPDPKSDPPLGTQTLSTTAVAPPPTSLITATASSSPSRSGSTSLSTGALVGATIGAVLAILLLTLLAFLLWRCTRPWDKRPWYKRCLSRDKGWRFAELDPPPKRYSVFSRPKTTSSSSFGSTGRSLKSTTADRGLPMTEISPPSPDPMAFALNDGVSPLTQLQKSYGGQRMSMKSGVSKYSSKSGRSGKSGGGLFGLGWGAPAMPQPTYSRTRDRLAPGDGLAYPPRVLDQKR